ncbi:HlyD family efflux transporter periplasmic adaptor subunit [Rhizobium leguminosarum]|uniref:HlyD family efflux transporter periplasmic adaptor subunit n=1 Tax=Rhizobium leguminosarum TaxID=384 RepID=UPI000487BB48|nr:HlyD family efflux transporter periplasmic adaptor subunit [Rhizobium leguminosarum]
MEERQPSKDGVVSLFRENAVVASTNNWLVLDFEGAKSSRGSIISLLSVCTIVAGGFLLNSGMAAVEAPGMVTFLPAAASIKSPHEGVVDHIFVADGVHVIAGQKIANIVLDSFDDDRISGTTNTRLAEIKADEERLRAELGNQKAQFAQERVNADSQRMFLGVQMASLDRQIDALENAASARYKDMEIVNNLGRRQLSSGRDQNEIMSQYYTALSDKLELNVQRDALEKELDKLAQETKLKELASASTEQGLNSQLRLLEIEREKLSSSNVLQLEAPVSGKIQLFRKNDQSVIGTGEVLAAVVPDKRSLYGTFNVDSEVRSQLIGTSKKYTMSVVTDSTVRRITGTLDQLSDVPLTSDHKFMLKVRLSDENQSFPEGSPLTLRFYRVRPQSLLGNILTLFSDFGREIAMNVEGSA